MLNAVSINNFQSLEQIDFNFSEGLNVIVGPSDIGKSAVLRAIMCSARSFTGDKFISEGKKNSSVRLAFNDLDVKWSKARKSGAKYELNNKDTYEKFGSALPVEVENALNLSKVDVLGEDLDINFTDQFTLPFLLFDTPLNRARLINELAGLSILSKSLQEARKRADSFGNNKTRLAAELDEISEQLINYSNVDRLQEYSLNLKKYFTVYASLSVDANRLNNLILPDLVSEDLYVGFSAALLEYKNSEEDRVNLARYILPVYVDPDLIVTLRNKTNALIDIIKDKSQLDSYVLPIYVDVELIERLGKLTQLSDILALDHANINRLYGHLPELLSDFNLGEMLSMYFDFTTDLISLVNLYDSLPYNPGAELNILGELDYDYICTKSDLLDSLYYNLEEISLLISTTEHKLSELGIDFCPVCGREF